VNNRASGCVWRRDKSLTSAPEWTTINRSSSARCVLPFCNWSYEDKQRRV
jgi:hypothetical protein